MNPSSLPWVLLLLLLPSISPAQSYLKEFPHEQLTKYFHFYYKRSPERIAPIARFADGFVKVINRDFFKAEFNYPITVLVMEDRPRFQDLLRREFKVSDPPGFGIYIPPPYKLFATYEESGLGTFAHEIMHPLVERNLKDRPLWAIEGIPSFFEKFYGYWDRGELMVSWGYHNPWRIESLGSDLVRLDLKAMLSRTESRTPYNQSDTRLLSMFLWEHGKFERFLRLIEKRDKHGYTSYFEAAMEMPIARVLPLWQTYLNEVAAKRNDLMLLPASSVLESEEGFRPLRKVYGLREPSTKASLNSSRN